ncbi:MAG: hypothetical protein SFX73_22605 [Kofleriaceae bacterium]|nr:hypothetical protein [Kofleriaceae bacterium]
MRYPAVVVATWLAGCSDDASTLDARPLPTQLPSSLADTGIYKDFDTKQLASDLREFAPANVLWSDAAVKTRWIRLPAGAEVDNSDNDRWLFPVGTTWFKEFAKDGKRLETRVIWRVSDTGDRERDTLFGAYVWNDVETEAILAPNGEMNVRGTEHDVPSGEDCWKCHIGEPGRALGYSALQLGDVTDVPLAQPLAPDTTFAAPNAALGYLHANCGHCHNPAGSAWVSSSMQLRLSADDRDAATTAAVRTTVGVALQQWVGHGFTQRVVPGDPDASALLYRMTQRTSGTQMPPLATERIDDAGVTLIRNWISTL